MRKLLIVMIPLAIFWYAFRSSEPDTVPQSGTPLVVEQGVYDEYGIPVVQVFTINGCTMCQDIMKRLERRNVPFETIHLNPNNQDDENFQRWRKIAINRLPFIIIGDKAYITNARTRMVTILGGHFGAEYLTDNERRYFTKHFNVDGSPRIVMYGTSWCSYCAKLKKELEAEYIDYLEVDVEKSGEEKLMSKVMGIEAYPTTWVGYTKVDGITLAAIKRYL